MRRRLLNISAGVSLMLCLATAALWMRSYWHADCYEMVGIGEYVAVESYRGSVRVSWIASKSARSVKPAMEWRLAGFGGGRGASIRPVAHYHEPWTDPRQAIESGPVYPGGYLVFPHWGLVMAAAVLPVWWLVAGVRRRRLLIGHCSCCGYDLRGNPAGPCPECGGAIVGGGG